MSKKAKDELSDFARAALALDVRFEEFCRLSQELQRVTIDSDSGLERARILLKDLNECREGFTPASQDMARALEDARQRTALAAQAIETQEQAVQQRISHVENMLTRYRLLGDTVRRVTTAVSELKYSPGHGLSQAEQTLLQSKMPELSQQMGIVVDEARKLMDEAREANMKTLERNADSLRQSVQASMHRFTQLSGGEARTPHH